MWHNFFPWAWPWGNSTNVWLPQNTSLADENPTPNSPSSLVNQYRLEDDEQEQNDANIKDLLITVDNPESRVTAIETFIAYRVVTKVRRLSVVLKVQTALKWAVMGELHFQFEQ